MKDVSELVFILDKSGSMGGKEKDIIGGFNSSIAEQKKKDYKTLVTTVLFSNNSYKLHDRVDINEIKNMEDKDYVTNGSTALIDAMGSTIEHIKMIQKYAENKPKRTLFIIMTDGEENASHKYSSDEVKSMIKEQENNHWEFIFMGANIDAVETAKTYGIKESRAASFNINEIPSFYRASVNLMSKCLCPDSEDEEIDLELSSNKWKEDLKSKK